MNYLQVRSNNRVLIEFINIFKFFLKNANRGIFGVNSLLIHAVKKKFYNSFYNFRFNFGDKNINSRKSAILKLCKKYNLNFVLFNLNLKLYQGDMIGLFGENGSGKSTLLKIGSGYSQSDFGSIKILNKKLSSFNYKKFIQKNFFFMSGGEFGLISSLNMFDNIYFFLLNEKIIFNSLVRANMLIKIRRLSLSLYRFYLKFEHTIVNDFSKGMKQKLKLIFSLIVDKKIFFLDEPFVGLDIKTLKEILIVYQKINKLYNKTILITMHEISGINPNVFNKILFLENGSIDKMYDKKFLFFKKKFCFSINVQTEDEVIKDKFEILMIENKKLLLEFKQEIFMQKIVIKKEILYFNIIFDDKDSKLKLLLFNFLNNIKINFDRNYISYNFDIPDLDNLIFQS